MTARASLPETRNPLLALPSAARLVDLDQDSRELLLDLLAEFSADARQRADKAWRTHKGPIAAYWKAAAVYARHMRVALRGLAPARPRVVDLRVVDQVQDRVDQVAFESWQAGRQFEEAQRKESTNG